VEMKCPANVHCKRNVSYRSMKIINHKKQLVASNPKWTLSKETSQEEKPRVSTQRYALRNRRNCQPKRLKDRELRN